MSTFKIPNGICKGLDALIRMFWWESKSWVSICQQKDHGGLGFKKFKDLNLALLRKLASKIASREDAVLANLFRAKYLNGNSLFSYKAKKDVSHV